MERTRKILDYIKQGKDPEIEQIVTAVSLDLTEIREMSMSLVTIAQDLLRSSERLVILMEQHIEPSEEE